MSTTPPETAPRKGKITRSVEARDVTCHCIDCGREFGSTGAAHSHSRASRHTTACAYAVRFRFVPDETKAGRPC